jgi:midasin (ATPase involved in ribosome maturation)
MHHMCTTQTDLDELIGTESCENHRLAFRYGPLALAMKRGEELVLDNSSQLSLLLRAKLPVLLDSLTIEETSEIIHPGAGFRVTYR